MFPTPIAKTSQTTRISYKILVPISLLIWLIPLLGVMMTALRGPGDITAGNLWGMPTDFRLIENLADVFSNTPMLNFIINSFKITVPTMIGAVAISCMTGFALAAYRFKGNLLLFSPLLQEISFHFKS